LEGDILDIIKDRYTITELSEQLSVTDHTLRYYEKEFRIPVPKDERGRRYYTSELANLMYQIKNMRNEGLEIKAIKRILHDENLLPYPPPLTPDDYVTSVAPAKPATPVDIRQFFEEFKNELTASVASEVSSAREYLSREINKTKLELGACVENNFRKFDSKLDKHFSEVDRLLTDWREKKKKNIFQRIFKK